MTKISEQENSSPLSRFHGVVRFDNFAKGHEFALECPKFSTWSTLEPGPNGETMKLPDCMRSKGRKIVLRAYLDEFVAGQLYVFVIRLLFGKGVVDEIHAQCTSSMAHVEEILQSIGVMQEIEEVGGTGDCDVKVAPMETAHLQQQ